MSDDTREHVDIIDNVETQTTSNGNEYVKVTTRDGTTLSCWSEDWWETLFDAEGEEKLLVYVQNGKYKNIESVLPPDQASTKQSKAAADNKGIPEKNTGKTRSKRSSGGMDDYVTWEETLAQAYDQFDELSIETVIVQNPHDYEGVDEWVVKATVTCDKGVFTGIGDASPVNVNSSIAKHLPRMAETRAMSRAVKHALGIGKTGKEEIPDGE